MEPDAISQSRSAYLHIDGGVITALCFNPGVRVRLREFVGHYCKSFRGKNEMVRVYEDVSAVKLAEAVKGDLEESLGLVVFVASYIIDCWSLHCNQLTQRCLRI